MQTISSSHGELGTRAEKYLSAESVGRPQRHGESLTVTADVVTVVEDGVLGTKEYGRSTMW